MAEETEDLPKIHARIYPGENTVPLHSHMQLVFGHYNNVAVSAVGVLVSGDYNVIGEMAQNISLLNSSGCIVVGGLRNVTIINSSGVIVTEENTIVQNNIFILSPSSGVTTYTPYKKYIAVLTQSGTDDPVAIVFENTLGGTIAWTRTAVGLYNGTLSEAFTANKTFLLIGNTITADIINLSFARGTNDVVSIGTSGDGILTETSIEIRIYP